MRAELIELRQKIGQTMVYVTHDQLEAMTMSDRIAVMRNGVLQQYGVAGEIYHAPANLFVAGFIGTPSMNFVEGELARAGDRALFRTTGWRSSCRRGCSGTGRRRRPRGASCSGCGRRT